MYPHCNHLNVPTWIIGPALGEGPLIDRPADVLKVWPAREPIQGLPPAFGSRAAASKSITPSNAPLRRICRWLV
jgi:hypothetical protein